MKNSMQIVVYLVLQHLSFVTGAVTLNFNSIGYIGESIVLQCTDTAAITVNSADWYRGGSQLDISLSRYNQTKIANGFNLTIFSVVSSDGGVYYCGIDFGVSSTKTLTIYYNTKDVNIKRIDSPKGIEIAIIAFPDPVYTVTVTTQDGNLTTVNWTISKTTQTSGAIQVLLQNYVSFLSAVEDKNYTVVVSITSPVTLVVTKNITWASDETTTNSSGNCTIKSILELALGDGLGNDTICIICLICIVILVKIVNIQAEDELQKPKPRGSDVTITASVCGFCKSSVKWTGPHGKIKAIKGKYEKQYNRKTGLRTLKISNLEINDSGLYTCHAKSSCGSLAQDSVRISVYEQFAVDIDIRETFRQHGSDVKIICSVYGPVDKGVNWTGSKENILTTDERYTIAPYDSNTNESSLTIRTSSMTNAEDYICQVAFKGVSVKIYIKMTKLKNGSLRVTIEKIVLFAPASENESREWIGLRGKTLTDTAKYAMSYDSNTNESHLTIKKFSMNDNGSYTCQPKNSSRSSPKNSITVTINDATDYKKGASKLILGLCFGIMFVSSIACIVILVMIGEQCALKFGLGHGLGLGIPFVGFIIVIVILFKKVLKPQPPPPESRKPKSGSRSDVSRKDVQIQLEEKGLKNNEERPLHNRIGNKDESEIEPVLSKPFDPKERRPLPPLNEELKDKPRHRLLPIPSEKNDVQDQNLRGLSANFDDTRGLASEMPRRSKKLPPIQQQVQSAAQEEGTSEGPRKIKNRNEKDKTDEGKSADEIAK